MITREREAILCTLYQITSEKTAWLLKLQQNCDVTPKEAQFLEWLDEREAQTKSLKRFPAAAEEDASEKLGNVLREIWKIEQGHEQMRQEEKPHFDRMLMLWSSGYEDKIKRRDQLRAQIVYQDNPATVKLSEWEIRKAREYPLENLAQLDRLKRMLCPFHDDKKPSMWVHNGFGYCFPCGARCDSIKYLMHTTGRNFVDVVRELAGRLAA